MAAADVATFNHTIDNAHMNMDFKQEKAPEAPFSPDGADLPAPTQPKEQTKQLPVHTEVVVVPSNADNTVARKTRMVKKMEHEVESRKASIRRLASRAFEKQTGKQPAEDMSQHEWDIYNTEVKKSEEILDRKKAEEDAAVMLANNIRYRENTLMELNTELSRKISQYQLGQDELSQVTKDFEDALRQHLASVTPVVEGNKSSSLRMQEEQKKKELKQAWRRSTSDDPVTKARQRQFAALEDINQLKSRIEELRKELGRMMGQAQKGKSSSHRMKEQKEKRQEMQRQGIPIVDPNAPVKVYVKKEPEVRSHMQRMQEEQARKAELRKQQRMSVDVGALMSRPSTSN